MSVAQPLFGILVQERAPLQYGDLPGLAQSWLQDGGGFAAVGLFFWIVFRLTSPTRPAGGEKRVSPVMGVMAVLAFVLYAAAGAMALVRMTGEGAPPPPSPQGQFQTDTLSLLLTAAGFFALAGILEPFVSDLFKLRWRRIWALAMISFKEAVRKRIVWVFIVFLLIWLFPARWFFPHKPENELRTTIGVIYWAMTPLLLLTGGVLAAFSIPTDVRSQTIHTIVTKPVERFEIVLGRFLGFTGLMTAALVVLTGFSLLLIQASSVDPQAAEESQKARVPVYGGLSFYAPNKPAGWQGDSVGREWEYRRYIAGGPNSPQRAIWHFDAVPADLAEAGQPVPMEFAFDIFRTIKGEENRGVFCTFTVVAWNGSVNYPRGLPEPSVEYERAAQDAQVFQANVDPNDPRWETVNRLAREHGYFEYRAKEVFDYHTYAIAIPPGLFEKALEGTPPAAADGATPTRVRVFVKCESPGQYIGVAPNDLYLLESNGSFTLNFFKGAFGLWLRLVLVIGLAVTVSTYLSGVISFLVVLFLVLAGYFRDFIIDLAGGRTAGGGPFESLNRLVGNQNLTMELDPTPTVQVAQASDQVFYWLLRRVVNVIPDVERLSWTEYVAEGFNIPFEMIAMNTLVVAGYLLLWGVLGYYLIRSREVATW